MQMKHLYIFFSLFILTCSAFSVSAIGGPEASQQLHFRENKNQWAENILFIGFMNSGNIFLEKNTITFQLFNGNDLQKLHPRKNEDVIVHSHVYRMHFENANPNPVIMKENPSSEYYNYFIGNDPKKWASEVYQYQTVTYLNLYPKIDFKVFGMGLTMKYEFIVHAGGNPDDIKIRYEGADGMNISDLGSLFIKTSVGDVVEAPPIVYQKDYWIKKDISSKYVLNGNYLQFKLNEDYNKNIDLIIDPTLIFSTFTGSTADNWGFTATYDAVGNLYLGGYVNTEQFGGSYPTTTGAFQTTYGGGTGGGSGTGSGNGFSSDMGITKFNSLGTALLYSTYLGGSDNENPHSLFVNSSNQLCVYGKSYSSNYPVTPGCFDNTYNGDADIVITVFNTTGTALIGSTYIGGSGMDGVNYDPHEFIFGGLKYNYGDDARGEIICDNLNDIYVASSTTSSDFPVSANAYQSSLGGGQDGCAFKLNPTCSSLIYSTYLGGTLEDACYSLDKKSDNTLYITGGTQSSNFPSVPGGVHPTYQGGSCDGYLIHLSADGSQVLNSTFLGTSAFDQSYNIKMDLNENVYVIGLTEGSYPTTAGVYSNPNSGQFITKLDPTLATVMYATVVGNGNGLPNISPTAFLIDTCENVYACGWGTSNGLFGHTCDMFNLPLTGNAFQSTTDGTDFYIIALSANAQQLLYGTYFGGNGAIEHVDGGTSRFDRRGFIYEAICAGCGGNSLTPTTPGVWSNTNNSSNCNELGFKMDINLIHVQAQALADPAATGCTPLTVNFINNSQNATQYFWDFGDATLTNDTSVAFQPTWTFINPGTYSVMLIANNPASCFGPDTAWTSVVVLNTNVTANFSMTPHDFCDSVVVDFSGSSSGSNTQFNWTFGDGTSGIGQNISHSYFNDSVAVVTYFVTLIIYDSTACNPLDTVTQSFTVFPKVEAGISNPDLYGCIPYLAHFFYNGHAQTSVTWDFGDQSATSNQLNPTHIYTAPGDYTVIVTAQNPIACNGQDTAVCHVHIFDPPPVPDFTPIPDVIMLFESIYFDNHTVGATNYWWNFGDGGNSSEYSPSHQYSDGGDFDVCLLVNTSTPCPDSVCKKITVLLPQAVGVPNAFSPSSNGPNNILYVEGQGITDFIFKVFNRWGEKVFETNDLAIGWDGIYNGKPQDMDVYVWELNALMEDGTRVIKSGNVTLLR
ncbi:MAG TPA: hypothetical protein DCQ93_09930 [Bacteroidetes bacterium]|nr:hypothetical protein [Bacteroidota bacterium]